MTTTKLNMVWANRPDSRLAVAEIWVGREHLWITIFMDDRDRQLKIELLPPPGETVVYLVELSAAERLIETAKRDLLTMASQLGQ
ncbi:hypothetical protein EP7_004972 [Isosphaeraceae bacterium EP7]